MAFQITAEIISLGDKQLNKKIYSVLCKYIEKIKNILDKSVKGGAIRADTDLEPASKMLFCMTQGLVNIWALSQHNFSLASQYKFSLSIFLKAISQSQSK
jgi:hypothetical protein